MATLNQYPQKVLTAVEPYLQNGENLLYAIDATTQAGLMGRRQEKWALLTDLTVFVIDFHGETASLNLKVPRSGIKQIVFAPDRYGVTLRFFSATEDDPDRAPTLSFPKTRRTEVNKFCEDLWKTIDIQIVQPPVSEASKSAIASAIDLAALAGNTPLGTPSSTATPDVTPHRAANGAPQADPRPVRQAESTATEAPLPMPIQRLRNLCVFFSSLFAPLIGAIFYFFYRPPKDNP